MERRFGILVSIWDILWRLPRVQYTGPGDLIAIPFRLHNLLPIQRRLKTGRGRPTRQPGK